MENLILQYGYIVVFLGTFLEGETILLLAGFVAHQGYLDIKWVIVFSILGSIVGDQVFYCLGRYYGKPMIQKFGFLSQNFPKALKLVNRFGSWIIFGQRFIYGFRILLPLTFGISSMNFYRFAVLNISSGVLWALIIGMLGYFSGATLSYFMRDIKKYEHFVALGIIILGLLAWLTYPLWKRSLNTKNSKTPKINAPLF